MGATSMYSTTKLSSPILLAGQLLQASLLLESLFYSTALEKQHQWTVQGKKGGDEGKSRDEVLMRFDTAWRQSQATNSTSHFLPKACTCCQGWRRCPGVDGPDFRTSKTSTTNKECCNMKYTFRVAAAYTWFCVVSEHLTQFMEGRKNVFLSI